MKHHDEKKARDALQRLIDAVFGKPNRAPFSIPARGDQDADLILSDVIDERDALRAALQEMVRTAEAARDAADVRQAVELDEAFEEALKKAKEVMG